MSARDPDPKSSQANYCGTASDGPIVCVIF